MNSRVSWSVEGIDPSVRERAEAAARRAGMSLSDWLNSTIGDPAPPNFRAMADQRPTPPSQETHDVADIHQRLDSITRQIERISRPVPSNDILRNDALRSGAPRGDAPRDDSGVARQLNDAISRLDARLSQISNAAPPKQAQFQDRQRQADMVERAAAQVYRPSPPLSPASFDVAIAEISARQHELDGVTPRAVPPRNAPPIAPVAPTAPTGPDFSTLERHLFKITSQIEALQRPDKIEQSIAAFRSELAEIRNAITEAMPRRAIESIENEIRSLSRRIDDTRQSGIDGQALAGIERALSEIRQALRSLTPAEQLAGYDEAIRNLGAKLDLILRASDDPSTIRQLEGAIAALRSIVSNVASNDALVRLSDDVRALSSKVDQLARSDGHADSFAMLEQRIAALTSSLESRENRPAASDNSEHIESALRALSDRLDRMPVGNDNASAFAHLEQRVSYLLERLEMSSDHRAGNLGRVEDGLQDILRHLETQHANFAALTESNRNAATPSDSGLVDIVKRELSDIRFSQSETDRHTQDSLEAVHNTLGHVVDRLAMIEGDLRAVRTPPVAPQPETPPSPLIRPAADRSTAGRDGAAAQTRIAESGRGTATFRRRSAGIPCGFAAGTARFGYRGAKSDQRNSGTAGGAITARRDRAGPAARSSARTGHPADRASRFADRAYRGFRKRHQWNSGDSGRAGQHVEFHRRGAPCRPGRRSGADWRQGRPRAAQAIRPGPGQGAIDDHLQDSLAAGGRERGRDRARHLQDGDDAAR